MVTEASQNFLKSFFRLLVENMEKCESEGEAIVGYVSGDDKDDGQAFRWHIEVEETDIYKMKLLCDFLHENRLVDGDKIIVSEIELIEKLTDSGWLTSVAQSAIDALMSTEVKMIDDGEETDSFYIHF